MFDEIKCKVPLPTREKLKTAAEWKTHTFQTKDLDNFLGQYEIRKSGLWVKEVKYKPSNHSKKKKIGKIFAPILEVESEEWVKDSFSGAVRFYDTIENVDDDHDLWIEFLAFFEDGKLEKKIRLTEWRLENNSEKKANHEKWAEESRLRSLYEKTLRFKYCFRYWNRFIRFSFRHLRRFQEWKRSFLWKLERWLTF